MSSAPGPEAVPFDPGSGEIPPTLRDVLTGPENPIILLVAAVADETAARTAIGLADAAARAAEGETLLADAAVDSPRLHRLVDVANLEGLVDVFLFGASLDRVRTRPDTRAFDFVPAGAYAPEVAAVLESSRWARLRGEIGRSGGRMLVFVPANTPGLKALSRSVGAAVVIGEGEEAAGAVTRLDPSCGVLGVVAPMSAMAPDRLAAQAGKAADPWTATIFDDPRLTEPLVFRRQRTSRSASPALLALLLLAALGAGGWYLYGEYIAPRLGARGDVAASPAPLAEPPERGQAVETPIPISVAVEAHQDLNGARQRIAALRRAEPRVDFYLSPVSVNGVLYFRLLAGPVADRETGMELMQRLVDSGHKTALDSWAVRPTELTFHLGEYDEEREAAARVDSLAGLEIPTYVVPVRYDPGTPRYRVYGGAYENQAEAQVMKQMLENAGLPARLVPRTGEPIG